MKRILLFSLFWLFLANGVASSQTLSPLAVNVDKQITINGVVLPENATLEDYQKVLGKPDRIKKIGGLERVFAYDQSGIFLLVGKSAKAVEEVYITFIYDGDKKVAKQAYRGTLSIRGKLISQQTGHEQISQLAQIPLLEVMKGFYVSKQEAPNLVLYYPEGPGTPLGQFGISFAKAE